MYELVLQKQILMPYDLLQVYHVLEAAVSSLCHVNQLFYYYYYYHYIINLA